MTDRTYYVVEIYEQFPGRDSTSMLVASHEAETEERAAEIVKDLLREGEIDEDHELRVNEMVRLDAPLTDEEEQALEDWIEELGEASDGSESDEVAFRG